MTLFAQNAKKTYIHIIIFSDFKAAKFIYITISSSISSVPLVPFVHSTHQNLVESKDLLTKVVAYNSVMEKIASGSSEYFLVYLHTYNANIFKLIENLNTFNGFDACGYFTLGKSHLTSILSNFTTFIIVLIQFKMAEKPVV